VTLKQIMKINITRRHLSVYIKESSTEALSQRKERYFYGDILVLLKDNIPHYVDLDDCLEKIEKVIPKHLVYGLDTIFIGEFPEFKEREINAFYRDGPIIYQDEKIAREFLGKRQRLFYILKQHGFKVLPKDFMSLDYSKDFDMFLLKEVGYPLLTQLTVGLFLTPYGTTSLREYFAESFETFFMRDAPAVKKISTACYEKIMDLLEV